MRALAVGLGALLLVVGYWWWQGRMRPVLVVADPVPTPTAILGEVTVHVRGRVEEPGVVTLASGSRVMDAIDAAGGLRPGAHAGDLNLARVLVDGEQVAVGLRDRPGESTTPGSSAPGGDDVGLLNLNVATVQQLEALPGIGPVLAQRIVQWRTDNGPFPDVEILGEVSGIGDVLMEQLRPLVAV